MGMKMCLAIDEPSQKQRKPVIRPEDTPLYGAAGDSGDFLTPKQLQALISKYEERAVFEEREGCFGLAEVFWKRAFRIASKHFPRDKGTACVARRLGVFISQFQPKSVQSDSYLRTAVAIEESLDSSSADHFSALLDLSQGLIATDQLEEAESILNGLLADLTDAEQTLRVKACIARLRIASKEFLRAEEILRTIVDQARVHFPGSEVLADILSLLGEVLISMDRFTEGRAYFDELIALPNKDFVEKLLPVLRRIADSVTSEGEFEDIEEWNAMVVFSYPSLDDARTYVLAELLTIQSDVTAFPIDTRVLFLLKALALYRSVQPKSWYVARVLAKLYNKYESLDAEIDDQLSKLLKSLPLVSVMQLDLRRSMPNVINPSKRIATWMLICEDMWWKLLNRSQGDELVTGECLLALTTVCQSKYSLENINKELRKFTQQFPSSKSIAFISARNSSSKEALQTVLDLYRNLRLSPHIVLGVLYRLMIELRKTPRMKSESQSLMQEMNDICAKSFAGSCHSYYWLAMLAWRYEYSDLTQAENLYKSAVDHAAKVDPQSSHYAESLMNLGHFYVRLKADEEAETYLRQAADAIMRTNRLNGAWYCIFQKLLSLYMCTYQDQKHYLFYCKCIGYLKLLLSLSPHPYLRWHLAEILQENAKSVGELKHFLTLEDAMHGAPPSVDALDSEAQRFYEFNKHTEKYVTLVRTEWYISFKRPYFKLQKRYYIKNKYQEAEVMTIKIHLKFTWKMETGTHKMIRASYQV